MEKPQIKLQQIIEDLDLIPIALPEPEWEVTGLYCGDLLSDVLAHAEPGAIWMTVQGHVNTVAVAQLRDLACVILVNGVTPDPQTVAKAKLQDVNLCGSSLSSAELCMKLADKF